MSLEIRQFNLVNSNNEVYTLTVSNKYTGFLSEVDGLGYERTGEYQKIGSDYVLVSEDTNQGVISGTIQFFQPRAYQEYTAFARYCDDRDLTLYYQTPTGLYMRKGSVTKIEKSEGSNSLKVIIDFTATTLWYQEVSAEKTADAAGELPDDVELISDSINDSPCCLSFSGVVADSSTPLMWSQSVDGTEIMTGELSGDDLSISETDTVYIRTDTNPYRIYKVDEDSEETDLYSLSDFSTDRFPFLYKGSNIFSISSCSPGSTTTAAISVEGSLLYETV